MKCPVIAIVIPLLTEIALTTYKLSYVTLQCLVDSGHSLELYHMLFPLERYDIYGILPKWDKK